MTIYLCQSVARHKKLIEQHCSFTKIGLLPQILSCCYWFNDCTTLYFVQPNALFVSVFHWMISHWVNVGLGPEKSLIHISTLHQCTAADAWNFVPSNLQNVAFQYTYTNIKSRTHILLASLSTTGTNWTLTQSINQSLSAMFSIFFRIFLQIQNNLLNYYSSLNYVAFNYKFCNLYKHIKRWAKIKKGYITYHHIIYVTMLLSNIIF